MTRATPAGAVVSLHVDLVARVAIGDIIETQSGRRYLAQHVRMQTRGKHVGRQHIAAVVLSPDDQVPTTNYVSGTAVQFTGRERTVHRIRWYPRGKK